MINWNLVIMGMFPSDCLSYDCTRCATKRNQRSYFYYHWYHYYFPNLSSLSYMLVKWGELPSRANCNCVWQIVLQRETQFLDIFINYKCKNHWQHTSCKLFLTRAVTFIQRRLESCPQVVKNYMYFLKYQKLLLFFIMVSLWAILWSWSQYL